jgi:hypothetical protein
VVSGSVFSILPNVAARVLVPSSVDVAAFSSPPLLPPDKNDPAMFEQLNTDKECNYIATSKIM